MKKKIGLVLNNPINYSETFFLNEIALWKQLEYNVIVFEGYHEKTDAPYKSIKALPPLNKLFKGAPYLIYRLLKLVFTGLPATIKFYHLEKKEGVGFVTILKKIYKAAHILSERIDYLHFGFANVAVGKELLSKALNAKFSISLRGADISIYPLKEPTLYQKTWEHVDKIHSISKDLYKKAVRVGLSRNKEVSIIYQTLDLAKVSFKEKYGELNKPIKILTVGRLHWKKGFEYALQVIKALKDAEINIRYTIVGAGEFEDAIRFTVLDLGIQDIVHLTQRLPYEEVLKMMRESDLYIQTSVQEGFCNAVLEAQASGLLVIATDAEGISENVIDGITGWIVPKRDIDTMVSKIKKIINLPVSERETITLTARNRVENEFHLSRYQKEWVQFFS